MKNAIVAMGVLVLTTGAVYAQKVSVDSDRRRRLRPTGPMRGSRERRRRIR
jgi:hypothetical protein